MKVCELKKILASLPEEADDEYIEIHYGVEGRRDGLCGVVYNPSYSDGVCFYGYGSYTHYLDSIAEKVKINGNIA